MSSKANNKEAVQAFVHLHCHSCYSFLDGASTEEALAYQAAHLGMPALALTDHNSLAAAVKFKTACKAYGIQPIFGSELTMEDGSHLTLLAQNRAGYRNLCMLISIAFHAGGRRTPALPWQSLEAHAENLICLSGCHKGRVAAHVRAHRYAEAEEEARRLMAWFPDHLYIEMQDDLTPGSLQICKALAELSDHLGVDAIATNNVHYARREDSVAHDLLCCVRSGITVNEPHVTRPLNGEQYMKSPPEMGSLFAWRPQALSQTLRIAERCEEALPDGTQITPRYPTPNGESSIDYLRNMSHLGARYRYKGIPPNVRERLDQELGLLEEYGYSDYMLIAWDLARWSRANGIAVSGRGSAADSVVAYCLLITEVDAMARSLPFARFLAPGKVPDVDLDFANDQRHRALTYIEERFGKGKVAMACTFFTYQARGALRDIGKALAMPQDLLRFFSSHFSSFMSADDLASVCSRYPELREHTHLVEQFSLLFKLCRRIAGFPRHIGTHSSAVVIAGEELTCIAPMLPTAQEILPAVQLDGDDVEASGGVRLDVLCLAAPAAIRDAAHNVRRFQPGFRAETIPLDDPESFALVRRGEAIGLFQLESPAQMNLAGRLQPDRFEQIVASVALIRPGPVTSNAVREYVARVHGERRARVHHPALVEVLGETLGCVIYQEQVLGIIAAMTGCSEVEADHFRKALKNHTKRGTLDEARVQFIERALACHSDLTLQRAEKIWKDIEGWGSYGFAEGHAAAFAIHAMRTAYLSTHHSAAFFAGLLSNQPMGFYSPQSLVSHVRLRGVRILRLDINLSEMKCVCEEEDSIRIGFCLVAGMREEEIASILEARLSGPFLSLLDFCKRVTLRRDVLESLILARAFESLHPAPRRILWKLEETMALGRSLRAEAGKLSFSGMMPTPAAEDIEDFSPWQKMLFEWQYSSVTSDQHPIAFVRPALRKWRLWTTEEALRAPIGTVITSAGINIRPHRPPTKSGRTVMFSTLEDETGILQLVCTGEALEQYAGTFIKHQVLIVRGKVGKEANSVSITVMQARPLLLTDAMITEATMAQETTSESWPAKVRAFGH